MTSSALWAVRAAFYARLSGDATLATLLTAAGRVYTAPPKNVPYPYCVLGNLSEVPGDTLGISVKSVRVAVHFVSVEDGAKQLEELVTRCAALFDRVALTLTGFTAIHVSHAKTTEARYENAGQIEFAATVEFDVLAQEP